MWCSVWLVFYGRVSAKSADLHTTCAAPLPPPPPLSLSPLRLSQSACLSPPSAQRGRVCLFVPEYASVCLSWTIRIISNLLHRSSPDWAQVGAPVWDSCLFGSVYVRLCMCVCLAMFPELAVPQDHRLAHTVLLLCVCVRPGATATGRLTISKERCVFICVCV